MKELSIEEKAIAYDEAIERAKHSDGIYPSAKELKEYIFPELRESEDERMKEAIIATIHLYYGEPLEDRAKEMIAWLENKLKAPQSHWKPSDSQMEAVRLAAEIGTANKSWAMGILKGMYQDLKKLREE